MADTDIQREVEGIEKELNEGSIVSYKYKNPAMNRHSIVHNVDHPTRGLSWEVRHHIGSNKEPTKVEKHDKIGDALHAAKKFLQVDKLPSSVRESVEMNEEGIAAASLHPAARSVSDPKALDGSKVSMMKSMLHMASGMGKEDMTHWFTQAMALIGHEADKVGDKSGHNQSSIDMKTGSGPKTKDGMPKIASITPGQSMKEDVEELFAGEDLSEEFKDKAATIFEAAVAVKAMVVEEELKEQFEAQLAEEVARIEVETAENLDRYLDYVVEEWMKENEVAIESALRTEMTADFLEGLKALFAEHYIELPEDKVDVVEQMADKVDELEKKLDEMISENNELKEELLGAQLTDVVEELASDMALTQQEKFKSLAEEIDFDGDVENFKKKLEIVKENYFSKAEKPAESNIETETFEGETVSEEVVVDPRVKGYVQAISRTVKK